jgi:hypothetical protein
VAKIGELFNSTPTFERHFKSLFPEHLYGLANKSYNPKIAKTLISDYLRHFSEDLLQLFLSQEGITKEELKGTWYLTTPGCWSLRAQRDFQELAHRVLVSLLPGSTVHVDLSEARASCEFLIDHLQLGTGIWAVTCDIGGATMDTAVCVTEYVKGRTVPVVFPVVCNDYPRAKLPEAVVDIDLQLLRLLEKITTVTGIMNLDRGMKFDALVHTDRWRTFRHGFLGDSDFAFVVEREPVSPQHEFSGKGFWTKGNVVTISSYVHSAVSESPIGLVMT